MDAINRVLVFDFDYLGDTLMYSPAIRMLKHNGVERVDVVTRKENYPVLCANPYVDNIYSDYAGRINYDLCLQFGTSFKTNLKMWATGIPKRLGFNWNGKGLINTIRVPLGQRCATKGNRISECMYLLEEGLGFERCSEHMIFSLDDPTDVQLVGNRCFFIATTPARDFERRKWKYFDELCVRLVRKYGLCIIPIDNSPSITFQDYAWLLKTGCLALITVNSFPMHLGMALDVPTVAIIGNTPAEVVINPAHKKILFVENVDNINAITVDEVMGCLDGLLASYSPAHCCSDT